MNEILFAQSYFLLKLLEKEVLRLNKSACHRDKVFFNLCECLSFAHKKMTKYADQHGYSSSSASLLGRRCHLKVHNKG
ncbi:hypothetical protein RIF29_10705 [Crotalaria pallida]|uniref:Uncharacterized protein n=1 Tax=Crotalaria pallida TaxID=3830 RepID=A0AAN9FVH3_CROPI